MKHLHKLLSSCLLIIFIACSSQEEPAEKGFAPVISGLEETYSINAGEPLVLSPQVEHATAATYSWLVNEEEVSREATYTFLQTTPQTYPVVFKVTTEAGSAEQHIRVTVTPPDALQITAETYQVISLNLSEVFPQQGEVKWKLIKGASDLHRLTPSGVLGPTFVAARAGKYHWQALCNGITRDIVINVTESPRKLSPYIAKVYDYLPAPGQFVNKLPAYTPGDTHEDMVRKANEWLVGEEAQMITLGGWGGYVVFGFDHTLINVEGKRDFRIRGNAFGAAVNGRPDAPFGGSCEPGIVMVAYDTNKNGLPDDEWYEIKGSSNFTAEKEPWYDFAIENKNNVTVYRDYSMTYYRPQKEEPDSHAEPDNPSAYISIRNYIRWKDNQQQEGYKVKNVYHAQSYYPQWIKQDELTFTGIRLPDNGINEGKYNPGINQGNVYFVLYGFRYGYVDNSPNTDDNAAIDIDWAIDKEGNRAHLPGISFIKIYNGINQENGWLGECSTEVERGEDLHMLGKRIDTIKE